MGFYCCLFNGSDVTVCKRVFLYLNLVTSTCEMLLNIMIEHL